MSKILRGLACLALLLPLVACATDSRRVVLWRYGIGSNVDEIWASQAQFYRNGKLIVDHSNSAGGSYTASSVKCIETPCYWAGGVGLPNPAGVDVPDKARVEIVSFIDRKRYRVEVSLPNDLEAQMRQVYQLPDGRKDYRGRLYFGVAPGGYYEVMLTGANTIALKPHILLARGVAEEVTDDWYDQEMPLERQYGFDEFDQRYAEALKRVPPPRGIAWAPIMDAYRAKQPRTDINPIH